MDTDEQAMADDPTERMKATRSKMSLGKKISKRPHQINGRQTAEDGEGQRRMEEDRGVKKKTKEDRGGQRKRGDLQAGLTLHPLLALALLPVLLLELRYQPLVHVPGHFSHRRLVFLLYTPAGE